MRIGIDGRLLRVPRGIGTSIAGLLTGLSRLPKEHEYFIYVDSPQAVKLIPACDAFTPRLIWPKFYPVWEQLTFPMQLRRDRIDVVHCPANTAPITPLGRTRLVLTVHDVIFLAKESGGTGALSASLRAQRLYYRLCVPAASMRASAIITDSEFSRRDILKYVDVSPSKVRSVALAAGEHFRELPDAERDAAKQRYRSDRYFVAPAAADPRKNTIRVIDAFARCVRRTGATHQLILFGLDDSARARFASYSQQLGIGDRVRLLGFVSEKDLVELYNAAEVMLYPSLYEGFGLPILEAMSCGAPVVTSATTSLPEVAGDAAVLVDPLDTEGITHALIDLIENPGKREALRAKGRARAHAFSWERMAADCVAIYRAA
ncbi:MAG TPA: glycosyltransferase family 1 protein [Candidatus Tumulicola sp.]|nr:glycosyltransferase family 1 protein [Candidatus Tumulicola sp.]